MASRSSNGARTREKLAQLEARLAELEKQPREEE